MGLTCLLVNLFWLCRGGDGSGFQPCNVETLITHVTHSPHLFFTRFPFWEGS